MWRVTTSTLMMETEIAEMLVFKSSLTRLIASEDFNTFIRHESFKSYKQQ
jgi:hypothetical protein